MTPTLSSGHSPVHSSAIIFGLGKMHWISIGYLGASADIGHTDYVTQCTMSNLHMK